MAGLLTMYAQMCVALIVLVGKAVLTTGLYNAALYKPAVQSSDYLPYYAYLAVDGNNDDNMTHGHCQHTWSETMPWWMVDLRGQFEVDTIILTNRGDLSQSYTRLKNFSIDVFIEDPRKLASFPKLIGDVCYSQGDPLFRGTYSFKCPTGIVGRFVRLVKTVSHADYLHICEMEVLVSGSNFEETHFDVKKNTKLLGSIMDTLTDSDPASCAQSCSTDNQILFVIDCRHEVREQIDFINQTVDYLRYNRNWTLGNVSYMTHEDKEPSSLEVLIANITKKSNEISNQCNDTISDFQKSFYHVEYTSISHKEGVEYCDKKYNSYLVSIETYEELDYLIGTIFKKNVFLIGLKSVYFHLGLEKTWKESFWSSGNPFTFYHNFERRKTPQCLYLTYNTNISDTSTFKDNNSIWRYLNLIDCDRIINETYIVCECHQQIQTEVDIDIKLLNKPDTFGLVDYLYVSMYSFFPTDRRRDLRKLNCTDASYTPYEKNNYFCKKTHLVPSIHTYVRSSYVQRFLDNDCVSECMYYYTLKSGSEINADIATSESHCYENVIYECPSNKVNMPKDLSIFLCKTTGESRPKCLKINYQDTCTDNSHLENCEHFQCPVGFIKCPRSYCIPLLSLSLNTRQCPLGQEKTLFAGSRRICSAKISLKIKDICINTKTPNEFTNGSSPYICDENCPTDYSCMSYRAKDNLTRLLQQNIPLYNVSNSLLPFVDSYLYFPYLQIVEIKVQNCKIQNVDKALRHWEKTQIVILDLSRNEISNSDDLTSVTSMTTLLFLNLSSNVHLSINDKFEFPCTLEVIDLSYTSVESLPEEIFELLHSLRMLDLSYTKIHTFENMGLPRYFTLDILNIEGVLITEITTDFYKGLTVNTSLMSSDFKLCCPQILGKNIPSGKCHAPDDAISSCKHIVGDILKRILVWFVGLLTIAGNGIVLFYRAVWNREKIFQTAYGLFVTGLAVSDLLMGVYLMIIALVDVVYADVYVVYDESWRKSFLCNFSGFLSTLSSETSTFLIGLITLDRFISISYPFRAHDTSTRLKWKGFISTWVVGFLLALAPAVVPKWQIYSSNGLCLALPLRTTGSYKLPGWEFSMAVYVILNFVLFLFIALGQVGIFVNAMKTRNLPSMRHCSLRRTQDMNIAKKLAFVALSDFLCWFPIGIMGILSLIGQEFNKETYAWMAVFVLPVNSALNPMIYTIPVIVDRLKDRTSV
ncbi:hypothetical protein Btru_041496 [Bulinus truncatus]|nr:hypothetical protein Btru_041496 [Bulinus truncatus]